MTRFVKPILITLSILSFIISLFLLIYNAIAPSYVPNRPFLPPIMNFLSLSALSFPITFILGILLSFTLVYSRVHYFFMLQNGCIRVWHLILQEGSYGIAEKMGFKVVRRARLPRRKPVKQANKTPVAMHDVAATYEAIACEPHDDLVGDDDNVLGAELELDSEDSEEELKVLVADDDEEDDEEDVEAVEQEEPQTTAEDAQVDSPELPEKKKPLTKKQRLLLKRKKRLRAKRALRRKKRLMKLKLKQEARQNGTAAVNPLTTTTETDLLTDSITNPHHILFINYFGVFCIFLIILAVGHTLTLILTGFGGRDDANSYSILLRLGQNTQLTFLSLGSLLSAAILGTLIALGAQETHSTLITFPGASFKALFCLPCVMLGIFFGAVVTEFLPHLRRKLVPLLFFTNDDTTTGERSLNLLQVPETIFELITQDKAHWLVRAGGPLFVLLIECVAIYTVHIISNAVCLYLATRRRLHVPPVLEKQSTLRNPYLGAGVAALLIGLYFFFALRPWNLAEALVLWTVGVVSVIAPSWLQLRLFVDGSYTEMRIWAHYESLVLLGMLVGSFMAHVVIEEFPLLWRYFPLDLKELEEELNAEENGIELDTTKSPATTATVSAILQHDEFQVNNEQEPKIELDTPIWDTEDPFAESIASGKSKHISAQSVHHTILTKMLLPGVASILLGLCIAFCDGADFVALSFVGMSAGCVESWVWMFCVCTCALMVFTAKRMIHVSRD